MSKQSFNPKKIYWSAAFAVLVIGIFILKASLILDLFGTKVILSMAHVGAISSGIFSLISLGYYYLRNQEINIIATILHLVLTFGLLLSIFYCIYQIDVLHAAFPQLDATKEEIEAFNDSSGEWGRYSRLAGKAFLGFIAVQIVFFVSLIFRLKSKPKV